jgi:hypothetical protein
LIFRVEFVSDFLSVVVETVKSTNAMLCIFAGDVIVTPGTLEDLVGE